MFHGLLRLEYNLAIMLMSHLMTKAVIGERFQNMILNLLAKYNLRFNVKDPVLREKLRPNYRVGCKRIVISGDFYHAVQKPNCHLETAAITEIVPEGVRTGDGTLHRLDALIVATGFKPFAYMRPMQVIGRGGLSLSGGRRTGRSRQGSPFYLVPSRSVALSCHCRRLVHQMKTREASSLRNERATK